MRNAQAGRAYQARPGGSLGNGTTSESVWLRPPRLFWRPGDMSSLAEVPRVDASLSKAVLG